MGKGALVGVKPRPGRRAANPTDKPGRPPGRPAGTPEKLTLDVQRGICNQLELGVPDKWAAESEGISERTYYEWLEKGAKGIEPYAAFSAAVTRARGPSAI
jgi:hypothetical protein